MWRDPIVEEIHRIRDEHAKSYGYDLHAIFEALRSEDMQSGDKVITRSPRRPVAHRLPRAVAEDREKYGAE